MMRTLLLSIVLGIFLSLPSAAQLVSGNAFLQGNYLEVGMAPCGVFGSSVYAPSGYHTQGSSYLGFVADVDKDGWTNGTPAFIGDYFRPGSPEEGFSIEINGTNYGNFEVCDEVDISGSFSSVNNSGATVSAVWTGAVNGLNIVQVTEFDTNTVFFSTTVTLTNTNSTTLEDVYYMRNVDPDNEQPLTNSWLTNNTIEYQNPNSQNLALVSATALTYGSVVALGAKDSRARVSHGGFHNRSASQVYNASGSLNGSGTSYSVDQAISIAFDLGDLSPGEATCLTFFYMFDTTEYSTALASTSFECINLSVQSSPSNLCQEDSFQVGYFLDTANIQPTSTNVFSVQLSDSTGSFENPVVIGTLQSTSPEDSIGCMIPSSTPFGTGYRIRVVMNSPSEIGADNGTDITIGLPQPLFGSSISSCTSTPTVLAVQEGAEFYVWSNGNTSNSITATTTGNYSVTVLNGSCLDTFSTYVTVYLSPLLFLDDTVTACNVDSAAVTAGLGYPQYAWSNGSTGNVTYGNVSGTYTLTVTNSNGCTAIDSSYLSILDARISSSVDTTCAQESVLLSTPLYSSCLYFNEFSSDVTLAQDINAYSGDDYGSIAVTEDYVYYTGDLATVRMDADNFSNKVQYLKRDGIFSDLSTGQLYTFWNSNYNSFYANQITSLRPMNENLTYQNNIFLSQAILNYGYGNGVFVGQGFVILYSNYTDEFYHISLPSGVVTELGGATSGFNTQLYNGEGWAAYGVAECSDGEYAVVYRQYGGNNIRRYNITNDEYETISSFGSLGDMSSFTYSPWNEHWYFEIEGGSPTFGYGAELFGMAPATLGSKEFSYLWSTGDSASKITITPNATQTYSVTISGQGQSCSGSKTIYVKGTPLVDPIDSVLACDTQNLTLDAGTGYQSYAWSNGGASQIISIQPGYNKYWVTVTDSLGCSAVKSITYIDASSFTEIDGDSLCPNDSIHVVTRHVNSCNEVDLTIGNASRTEVSSVFTNDASGLVTTKDYLYYNTTSATIRFAKDLTSSTTLPQRRGILVNTLTDQLLALYDTASFGFFGTTANSLVTLSPSLGILDTIPLSASLSIGNYSAVYHGSGYIVLYSGNTSTLSKIDLFSGEVETLATSYMSFPYAEDFAVYGVASCDENGELQLTASINTSYVSTYTVSTNTYEYSYLGSSTQLGFLESIFPDFHTGKWFFHYEGNSNTFGSGSQSIGSADFYSVGHDVKLLWSDGDSSSIRRIPAAVIDGLSYSLTLGSTSCSDTLSVGLINSLDLGLDDSLLNCLDTSVTLSMISYGSVSDYYWSTGDSTLSISANSSEVYRAYALDTFGCLHTDAIDLKLLKAQIVASAMASCSGDEVILSVDGENTCLEIDAISTSGTISAEIYSSVIDDRGGIAVNEDYVYYVGDAGTARLTHNLDSLITLPVRDYLFYDVGNGDLYQFEGGPHTSPNEIYRLDDSLNVIDTIELSSSLPYSGYTNMMLGSGNGFTIIGTRAFSSTWNFYYLDLTTGGLNLVAANISFSPHYPEGYTLSTLARCSDEGFEIIFKGGNDYYLYSLSLPSGISSPFHYFGLDLNDNDGFAYSISDDRWFAHQEGYSNLASGTEVMVSGTVELSQPKAIEWSTGATSRAISVTPLTQTTYSVNVGMNGDTCSDSITINVAIPAPFALPDTVSGCGTSVEIDAGSGFSSYAWNNGDTTQITNSSSTTRLIATVIDTNGCVISDTVRVDLFGVEIEQAEPGICLGDSMELSVSVPGRYTCVEGFSPYTSGSSTHTITNSFDDRSGIAISDNYVFATGDYGTVRFDKNSFIETNYGIVDGIFSDLYTGDVYSFWSQGSSGFAYSIDALNHYDENLSSLGIIPLSRTITISSYDNTVFAGSGFVFLYASITDSVYQIDLQSGHVESIASGNIDSYSYNTEGFASYGVATCDTNGDYLLHFRVGSYYLYTFNTGTGGFTSSTISTGNLGEMACFTFDPSTSRWYFVYEGYTATFGGSSETVGYADAQGTINIGGEIEWSTGDSTTAIVVSPTGSTNYSVSFSAGGQTCSDTTMVLVSSPPTINLDSSYSACVAPISIVLPVHNHYAWSSGDSTQTLSQESNGTLWAGVADTLGCWAYDTFEVRILPSSILASDSVNCFGDSIVLSANLGTLGPAITSFNTSGSGVTSIYPQITDDHCAIAVTQSFVYLNGDNAVLRYTPDLASYTSFDYTPSLFAEYGAGRLYKFWNASGSFNSTINQIIELDDDLNPVDTISLSSSIVVSTSYGTTNAVFPGAGYVILYSQYASTLYHIDLSDGQVTVLSSVNLGSNIYSSEGWAAYGIAQASAGGYEVMFRSTSNSIAQFDLSSVSTVSSISSLGDIANIAYSPWNERWYFSWEGFAFLGSYTEALGYASIDDGFDYTYLWSNGATSRSTTVAPTTSSAYSLTVSFAGDTCTGSYQIQVPTVATSIGLADTTLVCGSSGFLSAPAGFSAFQWNGASTGASYEVNATGNVSVVAIDSFGCPVADTTMVIRINGSIQALNSANCLGDSVTYVFIDSGDNCSNISSFTPANSDYIQVSGYTGDDDCGFAITEDYVYINGNSYVAKVESDLSSIVSYYNVAWRNAIFSDLGSGTPYALWSSYGYLNANYIDRLLVLDENLSAVDTVVLSEILVLGYGSGLYTGQGYVILYGNYYDEFYKIDLESGQVTDVGDYTSSYQPYGTEGWLNYGIADCSESGDVIYFRYGSSHSILSYVIQTGQASTASSFTNLGDAGMIGFSPWLNRWYGASEYTTQFVSTNEHVFSADASTSGWSYGELTWNNGATGDTVVYYMDSTVNYVALSLDDVCDSCFSCAFNDTVVVDSSLIISTTVVQNNSCPEDSNGVAYVSVGSNSGYTVLWSNGMTTDTIQDLTTGTYVVTVSTPNGCESIDTATITSPEGISIQKQVDPPSCPGDSNGAISLIVTGPFASYDFLWSTGSTAPGDSNLVDGVYSVTITDSNGCNYYRTYNLPSAFPVNSPNPITVSQNPVCSGSPVTVSAFSGLGTGGGISVYTQTTPVAFTYQNADTLYYEFVGMGTVFSETAILQLYYRGDLDNTGEHVSYYGEGGYFIGTSDPTAGCANYYGTKSIPVSSSLLNTWNLDDTVRIMAVTTGEVNQCSPKYQGYLRFNFIQGTKTYWFEDMCQEDPLLAFDSLSSFTFTPDTTVTFYARNYTSGCWSTCDSVTVNVQEGAHLATNIDTINLCDLSSINLKAEGADLIYWQPSTGLNTVVGDSVIASPANDQSYTIYGQNLNGCIDTAYVRVNVNESLFIDSLVELQPLCNGDSGGSLQVYIDGGNAPYTYLWNTGDDSTFISNKPAGNYWIYAYDTIGQCSDTFDIALGEPDTIQITIVETNISCFGLTNGQLDASATGGTAPYTYNWSTGASTQSIANLSAGMYTVTVTDSSGCTAISSGMVVEPTPVNVTITVDSIDCLNGSDGSLVGIATGGTAPFTYFWSNGGGTDSIFNLTAGYYQLIVNDDRGCTDSADVTLLDGDSIITTLTVLSQVPCLGDSSGSVTASSTAPNPVYSWSNGFIGDTTTSLPVGLYSVTTTSDEGCSRTDSVEIVLASTSFTLSIDSIQHVSCYGFDDGYAEIAAAGSSGPYAFSWSDGSILAQRSDLAPGAYTITVSDSLGCSDTVNLSISAPDSLQLTFTSNVNNTCFGDELGLIATSSAGGTSPHLLSWNTGDTASLIDSLASAVYSLTLTDANGCSLEDSLEIVTLSPEITYSSSVEDNACAYDSTGWVSLTIFGGAGEFSYAWSSGSDSSTAAQLNQGVYFVTATDSLGCSVTDSFEVLDLSDPNAVIASLAPVICHDDSTAALQITASGGVGLFSYSWNTGDTTSTLSSLPGGEYMVSATDSLGCIATDSFEVINPTVLMLHVDTLIHPLCNGDSNGLIEVSASGGLGIHSYIWSNAEDSTVVNSLVEGSYSVTVTDSLGCTKDTSVSMIDPDALSLNVADALSPLCNGDSNGIITTLTAGGTFPYAYAWNGTSGNSFDSTLVAGTYTIIVTDTNDCVDTAWQVISEPSEIGIAMDSLMDVGCFNASDGFIAVHGTGGVGNYAYTWNTLETDSVLFGLDTGSYSVQVIDSNGCLAEDTFQITQPDSLFATISFNANTSCYDSILSGGLEVVANGGTAPYTYSWSNGADSASIDNVGAGFYAVTVSDSNGCIAIASDTIVKDTFPVAGFEPLGAHCINADSISLGGGSPLGGNYFGSHVYNGAFVTSSSLSGQFEVYYVYQDANGCADTASSFIQIDSIPVVGFDTMPVACVNIGALPLTYGSPSGGVYFGNGVVGDTFYPTVTDTGSFVLGYFVTTEGGCSDTAYRAIVVSEYPELTYLEVDALCGNALPVMLTTGIPSGGTHFGEGVSNGMFNPASTGVGNAIVGYFYEHVCGVDTAFDTLDIMPFPSIDVDESFGLCINDSAYLEANEAYHSYVWDRMDTSMTHLVRGADLGIGSTDKQLIVSNEQGCSDSTVFTVIVADTQQISISDTAICLDQELYLSAPSGGNLSYTWSNGNVSQEILAYDGSLTRPEPRTIGLEVINDEGCVSQDSIRISVIDCDTLRPEGYFTVYPNPSNEKFTLELYLAYDQEITAVVYDVSGKILDQQVLALNRGKNWVDYTTERFGAGVIIIRFSLDDRVLATRVVIL